MNVEKLKPWNWFKREDTSVHQIPISKQYVPGETSSRKNDCMVSNNHEFGSLMHVHNEMDRLFDSLWHSFGMPFSSPLLFPSIDFNRQILGDYRAKLDVSSSDSGYEISVDLPGLSEDDIEIELKENILTVKGCRETRSECKEKQYYRVGSFQRTWSLPEDADRNTISANMKNGLLEIHIPRMSLHRNEVKHVPISS